jgi:DDE superfamily endonuclease/Helix-turn-helix of DDE superfamily endonuclease
MHLRAAALKKRPTIFERLSGVNGKEFERILPIFSQMYEQQVLEPRLQAVHRVRGLGGGQKGALPEMEDKLLFILVYVRIYPLLFLQGMLFGMAESKACTWVKVLVPVLDAALEQQHVRPKRARGRSLEEIIEEFPELKELGLLTDGTERPIRRPKLEEEQKEMYSGKKKRHTKKYVTLTHPRTQYILARTQEAAGSAHDKKILDSAALTCTSSIPVMGDSGFQGLEVGQAVVSTPFKRKRKKKGEPKDELTAEQKAFNTQLSKRRISIEHSNAGIKRSRSVSEILRNTRQGISDQLMMVAMGLHNLRVSLRVSYQF